MAQYSQKKPITVQDYLGEFSLGEKDFFATFGDTPRKKKNRKGDLPEGSLYSTNPLSPEKIRRLRQQDIMEAQDEIVAAREAYISETNSRGKRGGAGGGNRRKRGGTQGVMSEAVGAAYSAGALSDFMGAV